jgi:hypothetical protein
LKLFISMPSLLQARPSIPKKPGERCFDWISSSCPLRYHRL